MIYIDCKEYIPAKIDYILTEKKYMYLIGDEIVLEVITENTSNTLTKYKVEINGREVETTEFSNDKKFKLIPKCAGVYTFYKGFYKILALCKSCYSKSAYDDYSIYEIQCKE